MTSFITYLILVLIILAIIVVVAAIFYRRATREVCLIRTGVGGRKVVIDGGTLAIPYFHDISRVDMQTLRLEVKRAGESSLITKDRLRVDVGVEFYVSVDPTEEAIARASQTLGERTFDADRLRDLIEGKLVDTLRAVAARMTMDELHEKRGEFVAEIASMLAEPLKRNGLVLESVSLSALDQTPFSSLDENNAFNAVGMRKLAEVIAKSKKERAEIDRDAEISVHRTAVEASKRRLEIDLEQEQAPIRQSQEIEALKAAQLAEIAARKAESEKAVNAARITMEQEISIAEQERAIAVAKQSEKESAAAAAADIARAEAVKAAEAIATARALAEAQRRKDIALIEAEQDREINAEKLKANARAEAEASAERAKTTLQEAKSAADAAALRISTMKDEMETQARGQKAINEAENILNKEIVALRADIARLEALPKIVEQMVKPAEKIEAIHINHIGGVGGGGGKGSKTPINQALNSIMEMAVQLPALKRLGEEVGINLEKEEIDGVAGSAVKKKKKKDEDAG